MSFSYSCVHRRKCVQQIKFRIFESMNTTLADFYERDFRKLIEELNLFKQEENLWKTHGSIKNSAGNLALHLIGGTSYLIGTNLGDTGYVRSRDLEFTRKDVPRKDLVVQLELVIQVVTQTVRTADLEAEYPMVFDGAKRTNGYLLTQLLAHLNYHLGQVNYLRRALE